ncbi:UDP-N-acetylmuramoyl-tripeptide--D-alanyl-D-alanine ligase [Raineyella fluvialis]|uniref:UDP-N-acetylmuramoyl-tripeptide--D-alanyl-D-alanine ligase n=1 Tax=Raineyella fluvialis TaxID=2662261 RepID=A0A5Q2FBH8_9ACTN|nr:UDP-N-acetylmuramoyl-tripeptide--D-alanyl-D-alanine ligase [Raineyella fluvialis]QGF24232.1 UDP-N-acetylmuramoyl-tripeptide--D-alanyl-D-alanine ligase [Raineyella fluvialis]
MQPRSLTEIAAAIGARIAPPDGVELSALEGLAVGPDVVIDSRRATPGSLFVAFPGERVDGHDFVATAAAAGAAAAVTQRPVEAGVPCLVVDDPQRALAALARHVVDTSPALSVVGITGSSGKTSTKDLIAQVLRTAGPTVAPIGSFNNEIGAPLTATGCDATTRFLVTEMGARGIGHVAYLCSITPPTVAVVLNVGHAHLGEFGSQDMIAKAKGELVEAVDEAGWAVLNGDDPRVTAMASRTRGHVARFAVGERPADGGEVQVWATDVEADELDRHGYTLHIEDRTAWSPAGEGEVVTAVFPVRLRQLGAHQVPNSLAAAAAAYVLGLDAEQIAAALSDAEALSHWRMELHERPDGAVILNDSYNANPDSMASGLRTLARLGAARRSRDPRSRTWALIGDMLELGDDAAEEHRRIGALAATLGITDVVAIGDFAGAIVEGALAQNVGIRASVAPDKFALITAAAPLGAADVVLVKASRGLALETVADALAAGGTGVSDADETGGVR